MSKTNISIGFFPKLLSAVFLLSMVPLLVLGYLASQNLTETGAESVSIVQRAGEANLEAARRIGETAIEDSVQALDENSTEAIELRTVELAQRIADFLYERDTDIRLLACYQPTPQQLLQAYNLSRRDVIVPGPWPRPAQTASAVPGLTYQNPENRESWRHRPPDGFKRVSLPIYKEITFLGLDGRERIKVIDGRLSDDLRDVSRPENTYCKAEDYFSRLDGLAVGQIYVSRVIGAYKRGWLVKTGQGVGVSPASANAGKENPDGEPFDGIIRWATPVFVRGQKQGYLTMALDHRHVMEFTDHVSPTRERFTDIPDPGSGNYAFLWDDRDRCISHPRDFFICGYDPQTGLEVPGWISQATYDRYKTSGLTLPEFVRRLEHFKDFSMKKPGSREQMAAGQIGLDCGILDTAPQCQGWHRGTEDGGSGSFLILWSGLWKLTTYAAVPYHTGDYGKSRRGFGYVTIGANVDDFHMAANATKAHIEQAIVRQGEQIERSTNESRLLIAEGSRQNRNIIVVVTLASALAVVAVAILVSLNITRPMRQLTQRARAMSRGELDQYIEVKSHDELGELAKSFNEMAASVAKLDRMKSEFVTTASHELRTPIHAMMLGVSGILGGYAGEVSEEAREDLQIVEAGINRLRLLVDSLLDLSRIEAGKIQFDPTPTDCRDLIDQAVASVTVLADSHGHRITAEVPPGLPALTLDRENMVQVLVNLLSNSIKYTPDGGRIAVSARRDGDLVAIAVADNGFGIPEWAQAKVFEKFFQADSIMSHKVGGSGLGLTITKGIVEQHGGAISVRSPLPKGIYSDLPVSQDRPGTVFTVRLPLKMQGQA